MCHIRIAAFTFLILSTCGGSRNDAFAAQPGWSKDFDRLLKSTQVRAKWLPGGNEFWYLLRQQDGKVKYVRVNAETGKREESQDAATLQLPVDQEIRSSTLPETSTRRSPSGGAPVTMEFVNQLPDPVELYWRKTNGERVHFKSIPPGKKHRQSTYGGHLWEMECGSEKQIIRFLADPQITRLLIDGPPAVAGSEAPSRGKSSSSRLVSPDERWEVKVDQRELRIRDSQSKREMKVKVDLSEGEMLDRRVVWSPRSDAFVVSAAVPVAKRKLTLLQSTPPDQLQPKIITRDYVKPGDPLPQPVPVLVRLENNEFRAAVVERSGFPQQFSPSGTHSYRWSEDGREFYFDINHRGHQKYQILAVDRNSAQVRTVVEETSNTFVDYVSKTWRHWLPASNELLWMSERSGYCHLWRIDIRGKRDPKPVTTGDWIVRKVVHVDEEAFKIWFLASGIRPEEDPYHLHLCSVNFNGRDFQQLTQANGTHDIEFSPDRRFFLATWSRVDQPPVVELRNSHSGRLITVVEKPDIRAFEKVGYPTPMRFSAKGRDGKTDIYGVLIKPANFDPSRSYPVVERVYAGPHGSFAPVNFGSSAQMHSVADHGFIVVQVDGMGTNHRGKVFHDICWKNLKDAGFPDRMAWMRAAAKNRPWMNLSRVGIYGTSAGGQTAMRALLDHSDFYHAAVADCGCHDNRLDKIWWNEQWMGWPVDDSYLKSSNIVDAPRLRGNLLLVVGEIDENVDPASTYQVAAALQQAGLPFELMTVMNTGHGATSKPFGENLRDQFLIRHLQTSTPNELTHRRVAE